MVTPCCVTSWWSVRRWPGCERAETLRTDGFDGRLAVVGAEAHLPYDRPPLSKKVLAGEWEPDRIHLRKPDEYDDLGFDLRLGVKAVGLDTGSAPRAPRATDRRWPSTGWSSPRVRHRAGCPGSPTLPGIFELRTLDDSPRAAPRPGGGTAPRGGGRRRLHRRRGGGHRQESRVWRCPWSRRSPFPWPGPSARPWERRSASCTGPSGVDVRLGVGVEAMEGSERVERIRLTDGTRARGRRRGGRRGRGAGDRLAGGQRPGASRRRGVRRHPGGRATGHLRRRRPGALAATSSSARRCASSTGPTRPSRARRRRATCWPPARAAPARAYAPVPFFWSDQFDARIQFLGRAGGDDDVEVVHGALDSSQFVALYGRAGRFRGVFGLSSPKLVMRYRKLLLDRHVVGRSPRLRAPAGSLSVTRATLDS